MTNSENINIIWDNAYRDEYTTVTDSNDSDIIVAIDDLIGNDPNDLDNYVRVYYDGQHWWIPRSLHFPL